MTAMLKIETRIIKLLEEIAVEIGALKKDRFEPLNSRLYTDQLNLRIESLEKIYNKLSILLYPAIYKPKLRDHKKLKKLAELIFKS